MKVGWQNRRCHRGAALLAVIWLVGILGLACMTALRVISFDSEVATSRIHGSRARQLAEMGVAIASNPAVKRSDPLLSYTEPETGDSFEAHIRTEGGRFNLNAILMRDDKALLRSIFTDWGLELEEAQAVCDSLADWIDSDDNAALNGAEKDFYEKLGRINQPFNRPFFDLSEVRLVRGMDLVEAVKPDWREWFTVWSGGALDVNEADAELIAAAAECRVDEADIIPETVRGPDGIRDTEDDMPFQNAAAALDLLHLDANGRPDIAARFTANDPTTRIESLGISGDAKRKIHLVLRNRTGKPAILERTEEIIP